MALPSVYRTPEQYVGDLIASIQASGSKLTDFNVNSIIRTLFEAQGVGLSGQSLVIDQFRIDSHLETATGDALDAKGADYLVTRKAATAAAGTVRITRAAGGVAVTLPAGFSQLQTQPVPGQTAQQFATTQDAVFGTSDLFKDVTAVAVIPGAAGNVADQTVLFPINPVSGFATNGGFKAQGAFTGGVDAESDDAYRARIQVTVQGRVNGTALALQAAALAVPGVTSANVLKAGDARANGSTVGAGNVEVYYAGSAGLLTAVQSAVNNAGTLNQQITAFTANKIRTIAGVTVWVHPGTDTTTLTANIIAALQNVVNPTQVGQKISYSQAISAVDAVPNVVTVNVPLSDFRKQTDAGGTANDIVLPADSYGDLATADVTVAVSTLPS